MILLLLHSVVNRQVFIINYKIHVTSGLGTICMLSLIIYPLYSFTYISDQNILGCHISVNRQHNIRPTMVASKSSL